MSGFWMSLRISGCQNGAFGKRSFCWGDTRHFRHFRRFPGSEEHDPLSSWAECNTRIFASFRQNHLFSAGDKRPFCKTTVSTTLRIWEHSLPKHTGHPLTHKSCENRSLRIYFAISNQLCGPQSFVKGNFRESRVKFVILQKYSRFLS